MTGAGKQEPKLQTRDVTPNTGSQVLVPGSGFDAIGTVNVAGDANLVPANVKAGVNLFGVVGSYEKKVSKTYTLGMFRISWPYDELIKTEGNSFDNYGAELSYSGTTIRADVGEVSGKGTYESSAGTWTVTRSYSWDLSSSPMMYFMSRDNLVSYVTATASTTLPDGSYKGQVTDWARPWGGDASSFGPPDYEYRGTLTPQGNIVVKNGTATVRMKIDADNYMWWPVSSSWKPTSTEIIVFAMNILNS